ncbi:MAG: single-stranded-DNA-specific exonuclease RecJ [Nitrospirae bacterium]|nr:single-stranded-DNA-specific exonuclease RecJ [Nitrospirota bacterium]MBF0540270.1 single-stranded-DNA-specific exonuclease RecJ [Nitrospirota bacterium]
MQKKWLLNKTNKDFLDYMSRETNVSSITAQVLINRDIKTPDAAFAFFDSGINSLSDPFELAGIEKAVLRIQKAIRNREKILIHGDYDCDGITATVIMYEIIKNLGGGDIVEYFIPSRFDTGYGFHQSAVTIAHQKGITLIITVDCGITAYDAVNRARELNIDIIITDHHEPNRDENNNLYTPKLPDAYCIINPKINLNGSNNSPLSGAGVALMLGLALNSGNLEKIEDLIEIAMLGTIADVVPLTFDNRIIVKEGLKRISKSQRPGIIELIEISSLNSPNFKTDMFSFTIIPRINAAGRMGDANSVVKLLTTNSHDEAKRLAIWLNDLNIERQKIESEVLESAISQLKTISIGKAIIIADEDWHEGVLGIVASKMVDRYDMPAFVLNIKDGIAKGSARSIPNFDILKCLKHCSNHLIQYGGHKQAAGLKLEAIHIKAFTDCVNEYIVNISKESDLITTLNIDYNVTLKEINHELMSEFSRLEPFGYSNPEPLLGAKGLVPSNLRVVGRNHLKMRLAHNGSVIDTIGFDLGESISWINSVKSIDAVFTPTINEWNGNRTVQLNIKDLRPSNGKN